MGCGPERIMSAADQNMPAVPVSEAVGETAMKDWAELLVAQARADGVELTGDGGLLTGLVRQVPPDRPRGRDGRASGLRASRCCGPRVGQLAQRVNPPRRSPPRSAGSSWRFLVTVRGRSSR